MDKLIIPVGGYLARLRRDVAEIRARADAKRADPRAALRERITKWLDALPPDTRPTGGFVMEDLVRALRARPQQLGLALDELGWSRKRVWRSDGPFRRYWFPPER